VSPLILIALAIAIVVAGFMVWNKSRKPAGQAPTAPVAPVATVNATAPAAAPGVAPAAPVVPAASPVAVPVAAPVAAPVSAPTAPAVVAAVAAPPAEPTTPAAKPAPMPLPAKSAKAAVEPPVAKPVINADPPKTTKPESTTVARAEKAEPKAVSAKEVSFIVVSPKQRSDNLYRQAVTLMQESHSAEAQDALRQSLAANSLNHSSRQLLAGLLVEAGRNMEAAAVLREGLAQAPGHSGYSMALARLQITGGSKDDALATLERGLASAGDDPDYHAFYAALLQRVNRHEEATKHYITALRSDPSMPKWLIGVGVSLQAQSNTTDAAEAFQRALDTGELSAEVAQFATQQLKLIKSAR
jgi:MSHA biogenesis protein MshN